MSDQYPSSGDDVTFWDDNDRSSLGAWASTPFFADATGATLDNHFGPQSAPWGLAQYDAIHGGQPLGDVQTGEHIGASTLRANTPRLNNSDNSYAPGRNLTPGYAPHAADAISWHRSMHMVSPPPAVHSSFHSNTTARGQQGVQESQWLRLTAPIEVTLREARSVGNGFGPTNTQSVQPQWPEPSMRYGSAGLSNMHPNTIVDRACGMSPYPGPWNQLALRDDAQVLPATKRVVGCSEASSHSQSAENHSNSSRTMPSTATSDSGYRDLSDSVMTIRPPLTPSNLTHLQQHSQVYLSDYPLSAVRPSDAFEAATMFARRQPYEIGVGESSRSQRSCHAAAPSTETTSSVNVSRQNSVSRQNFASSGDPEILICQHEGCWREFTGKCRRGTRSRHMRLKHGSVDGLEEKVYHCEVMGCPKSYLRQDARLKHYRKRHSDVISVGAAISRK